MSSIEDPVVSLPGRDAREPEDVAWAWLEKTFPEAHTNDRDYSADEMADAFLAGSALSTVQDGSVREDVAVDPPTLFETWWATSPRKNRDKIGYGLKKVLAFEAFQAGRTLSTLPQSPAPISGDASHEVIDPTTLCDDCPWVGYPTDKTRCTPCPRRANRKAMPKRDGA